MPSGRKKVFQTKLTDIVTSDLEGIGTIRQEGDKEYIWCGGVASTVAGDVVVIDSDGTYDIQLITTTLGAVPRKVGVAIGALVASRWGWVQVKGYCAAIKGAASCAADVQLYTDTSTAAGVDDTAASEHPIHGMVLATALTSAGTTDGYLDYPWTAPTFD
jgi:hypothetical protein